MPELPAVLWRLIYGVFTSRFAQVVAALLLRAYARARSAAASEGILGAIDRRFGYSGWPYYEKGWSNLHVSRFTSGVRRRLDSRITPPSRRLPRPVKRIACIGRFIDLLGFPKELLERCPVELVVADIMLDRTHAGYLAQVSNAYDAFDLSSPRELDRLAAYVNDSEADLVLNIGQKRQVYQILDRLSAPCVANLCAGSDLVHHDAIDIHYHGQPEADYFVRDHRMFCGTTASYFSSVLVYPITGYMDPRGLLAVSTPRWHDRRNLIVCHGSLYKFASPAYVAILCDWLREDSTLELVLCGRDDGRALNTILGRAKSAGVEARVHYAGEFSAVRDSSGTVASQGWQTLVGLLSEARLAPNPFPLGGGSARFEAYAMGVPGVHLAVHFSPEYWRKSQPGTCEIPAMIVPAATAATLDEYREIGRRCLHDGRFAEAIVDEQLQIARRMADGDRWWDEILKGHTHWLGSAGHRAA